MNPAHIRRMAMHHIDQVMAIALASPDAPHWPRSAYFAALDPDNGLRRRAWVAEGESQRVVAFAVASLLPPQADLESIVVIADRRREGLARHLLSHLLADLKIFLVTEVMLEVRSSNAGAKAFYSALGFVTTAVRPSYYVDPVEDALLLSLPLFTASRQPQEPQNVPKL